MVDANKKQREPGHKPSWTVYTESPTGPPHSNGTHRSSLLRVQRFADEVKGVFGTVGHGDSCSPRVPVHPTSRRHALREPAVLVHDASVIAPQTAQICRGRCAVRLDNRVVHNVPQCVITAASGRGEVLVPNGLLVRVQWARLAAVPAGAEPHAGGFRVRGTCRPSGVAHVWVSLRHWGIASSGH